MSGGVKTTLEDLANLGWVVQDVYNAANAQRGGSMQGFGDLSLNDGIAAELQWWCYNIIIGDPYPVGNSVSSVDETETVWSYDNSDNNQPFTTSWSETWSQSSSATLTVSTSASITLSTSVTIPEVGGSDFSITISTDSSNSQTKEESHDLTNTWDLTIGPGETVSILRTQTTTRGKSEYNLAYGLNDTGLLGTKGKEWSNHFYWGFYVNLLLSNPRGVMAFEGYSEKTSYSHKIVRTGPVSLPKHIQAKMVKDGKLTKFEYMVPGRK